jgi:hypothetical protein
MARAKKTTEPGEKKTTTRARKPAPQTNGSTPELHVAQNGNLEETIRVRAYELYLSRGRQDGAHEHDWFQAESEIRSRTA